jgi:hypothetical protein
MQRTEPQHPVKHFPVKYAQIVNYFTNYKFYSTQCQFYIGIPFIIGCKNWYWYCIETAWNCFADASKLYWYFIAKIKMTRIGIGILLQKLKCSELVLVFYCCQKVCHAQH